MECFECGNLAEHEHHVVPRLRGGTKTVPLCVSCHAKAHHRDANMAHPILIREGLAKARAQGIIGGRRKTIDENLVSNLRAKGLTMQDIAEIVGCTRSAISKILSRNGVK